MMTVQASPKNLLANLLKEATRVNESAVDMSSTASIILGGGQGTRLFPLTVTRSKPAMCFGGRYRLIDVPISNAIHSGCQKIYVITQYLSASLHQHIYKTYHTSPAKIDLLPAEQKHQNSSWFLGTADAVRQNLDYIAESSADYFFILSGDQLYNLNFQSMLRFAKQKDADLVIASLPVNETDAKRMGLMQIDQEDCVVKFHEKPQEKEILDSLCLTSTQMEHRQINPAQNRPYLCSMGIYLFKRQILLDLLKSDARDDFGKHLIPTQITKGKTFAYIFQGYWEDIGTIHSYYHANMALTEQTPPFNCYDDQRPIFTSHCHLPGAKISHTRVKQSIICEGAIIDADEVTNSIIGKRVILQKGTIVRDSYVMGNDYFAPPASTNPFSDRFFIGENCIISKAIIDKHTQIGNGVQLINKNQISNYDGINIYIRDGIIIVPKGTKIPDGFTL